MDLKRYRCAGLAAVGCLCLGLVSACDEGSGSATTCSGTICLEIFDSYYSDEPCDGAPAEQCTYANVYFVITDDGVNAHEEISEDDVTMVINDREVGVEGAKEISQSNSLLVDLLLDSSYSIYDAEASNTVRASAQSFADKLPSDAQICVSTFASEADVPWFLPDGNRVFTTPDVAATTISSGYSAYTAATSSSQTKLYDAVVNLAAMGTPESQARSQSVLVLFTDGSDTASTDILTAEDAKQRITRMNENLKIYAIGLGSDVDEEALKTLSDDRYYVASSASDLQDAFESVSDALTAIYLFKVLVSARENDATARLTVIYATEELNISVDVGTGNKAGGGGCDDGQFECADGQCIHGSWQCDGEPDCMGGEDEYGC